MTKEQFVEKYADKAVWCKTEELAKEFLKLASSFDFNYPYPEMVRVLLYNLRKNCFIINKNFNSVIINDLDIYKKWYNLLEFKGE